jgi:hypothetical protein
MVASSSWWRPPHGGIIIEASKQCIHKEEKKEVQYASYEPPTLNDCEVEITSPHEPYKPAPPPRSSRTDTLAEVWESSPALTPPTPRAKSLPKRHARTRTTLDSQTRYSYKEADH